MKPLKHFRCTSENALANLTFDRAYESANYSLSIVQVTNDEGNVGSYSRSFFTEVELEDFVYIGLKSTVLGFTPAKTYNGYRKQEGAYMRAVVVNDHGTMLTVNLDMFNPVIAETLPEPTQIHIINSLKAEIVSTKSILADLEEKLEIASRSPYTLEYLEKGQLYSVKVSSAAVTKYNEPEPKPKA